jgi:hypothetical protein
MGRERKQYLDRAKALALFKLVRELRKHSRCPSSSRRKLAKACRFLRREMGTAPLAGFNVPRWIVRVALRVAVIALNTPESSALIANLR